MVIVGAVSWCTSTLDWHDTTMLNAVMCSRFIIHTAVHVLSDPPDTMHADVPIQCMLMSLVSMLHGQQ